MTDDLRRALDDLVAGTAAEHTVRARTGEGLPLAAMTARARRGRIRHTAFVSVVTAVALLGVAAGGVAAATWDPPEPQPAAPTPTVPAPSASPSASPTAAVEAPALPAGDPRLPLGRCGSLTGSSTGLPEAAALRLDVTATPSVLGGAPVEVRTRLQARDDVVTALAPRTGQTVLLARDGVVVAVAPTYPAGTELDTVDVVADDGSGGSSPEVVSHVTPVVCDAPDADGGAALPAGEYALVVVADVWTTTRPALGAALEAGIEQTRDELLAALSPERAAVVSRPVPVVVAPGTADPASVPQPPAGAPDVARLPIGDDPVAYPDVCRPESGPGDPGALLSVSGPSGTVQAGTTVEVGTTYSGSGRVRLTAASLLRLERDGVVVATSPTAYDQVDVDFGSTFPAAVPTTGWLACDGGVQPYLPVSLEPGTYTAYPVSRLGVLSLVGPDGTVLHEQADGVSTRQVIGAPFTFVVAEPTG